jgi:hypothetical protein
MHIINVSLNMFLTHFYVLIRTSQVEELKANSKNVDYVFWHDLKIIAFAVKIWNQIKTEWLPFWAINLEVPNFLLAIGSPCHSQPS